MSHPPKKPQAPKPKYRKPTIKTESLTAVAAVCNGIAGGGRKATTPTCNASKLKS
jgi:hypothetical protein